MKLTSKLNYLWRSCAGELSKQNDLFRPAYAPRTAKDMHWAHRLLSDWEWAVRHAAALNPDVNGIYLSRTNLAGAFDDNGRHTNPLMARLTGRVKVPETLFNHCGWQMTGEGPHGLYVLTAEKPELTEA